MDRLVVLPRPMPGENWGEHSGPPRRVTILAYYGSTKRGWQEGRTALVVDEHGNADWIGTDGLQVTDPAILPAKEEAVHG